MDITVVGRNAEISSRLRDYVEEKAAKVEQLDPRVQRVEVEVTHERNPRQADTAERAEITVISKGPIIRAEASSSDRFAAFDIAEDSPSAPTEPGVAVESQLGDSPVIVRQKLHQAVPMTVDEALYQMELVGHPFYLFLERSSKQPCAVYHRHGWTYGVIRLDAQVL